MVHSPGPWATADAASTIMLAAIPPDNSLKRFIADLMLRMRVVRNGTCNLPVSVANPRGQGPGGPRSRQATAIVGNLQLRILPENLQLRILPEIWVISPGPATVNQARKGLRFQGETTVAPRHTRAPPRGKGGDRRHRRGVAAAPPPGGGGRRQPPERRRLFAPRESGLPRGGDHHTAPRRGHRQPGEQRGRRLVPRSAPAFQHEPA